MRIWMVGFVALAACRKPPEPPPEPAPEPAQAEPSVAAQLAEEAPPELSWSSVVESGGKLAEVKQVATGRRQCTVTAAIGPDKVWSADGCLATRMQLRFVSPDAHGLIVLTPDPEADEPIGRLYRDGQRVADLTPLTLRLAPSQSRVTAGKLRWLGPSDQRLMAAGVEVQLIDGAWKQVRFDGAGLDLPKPQAAARPEAPVCAPCSYTDDQGTYHVVETFGEIPQKYRKQAGRIRGELQRADAIQSTYVPPVAADTPKPPQFDAPQAQVQQGQPNDGVPRNQFGEDFIQYNNRIASGIYTYQPPEALKPKCIDNSGNKVDCDQLYKR